MPATSVLKWMEDLCELKQQASVVISITGGAQDFSMPPRLHQAFAHGVPKSPKEFSDVGVPIHDRSRARLVLALACFVRLLEDITSVDDAVGIRGYDNRDPAPLRPRHPQTSGCQPCPHCLQGMYCPGRDPGLIQQHYVFANNSQQATSSGFWGNFGGG